MRPLKTLHSGLLTFGLRLRWRAFRGKSKRNERCIAGYVSELQRRVAAKSAQPDVHYQKTVWRLLA
jgi:hypothetical protein